MAEAAPWLATMRGIVGTEEYAGGADNLTILGWRDEIARRYPEMASYCRNYTHDSIPWCGLVMAYVMAVNGVRPPFNPGNELESFLWAQSWKMLAGTRLAQPRPGCVLVLPRHVTLYERTEGEHYVCVGGNQSDSVRESRYLGSDVEVMIWPAVAQVQAVRRFTNITATVFADQQVAYADVKPGWNERPGVALPARVPGVRPRVRVTNPAIGRSVVCDWIDVGPWNSVPGDPYWETGARPQAESGTDLKGRRTNLAGIDLTPPAASAIGIDGKGKVDWEFVSSPSMEQPVNDTPQGSTQLAPQDLPQVSLDLTRLLRVTERLQRLEPLLDRFEALVQGNPILLTLLQGQAQPSPIIEQPAPTPVAPTPADTTPILQKPSVQLSAGAFGLSTILQALGFVGMPIGEAATQTGTLATLAPIVTGLVGMTGGWGALLNVGLKLIGGLVNKKA